MHNYLSNYIQSKKGNFSISISSYDNDRNPDFNGENKINKINDTSKKNSFEVNIKENEFLKNKDYFFDQLIDMKENEIKNIPIYFDNIFKNQEKFINEKNRAIIIEWLSFNNSKWKLHEETLFLAVNIMDRYLAKKKISLNNFQLLGLTAFMISSKFEDSEPPSLMDLLFSCKNSFSQEELKSMEYEILSTLNFDILFVSSYKFLSYFYYLCQFNNKKIFFLANFILELCLIDIEIMKYNQGQIAIAVLLVAKNCLHVKSGINIIKNFYDFDREVIRELQKKIVLTLAKIVLGCKSSLIINKFEEKKFMNVSMIFRKKRIFNKGNTKEVNDGNIFN